MFKTRKQESEEQDEDDNDEEDDEDEADSRGSPVTRAFSFLSNFMSGFLQTLGCFRRVEMLNVPSQSFPAVGSQQRVAPSGQSRNKVALKPGHSLMDWIRLTKSGRDMTGLRGRLIDVTEEELRKHNKRNDCWTCIRGMVYNVTAYMDFHPGGEDELMRAAGIDGTDLFDQVHRWVNYESMLKECLVGRMATKVSAVMKAQSKKDEEKPQVNGLAPPPSPAPPPFPSAALPPPKDTRPRYDWFQTDTTVNIVVYTKRKIPAAGSAVVDLINGALRIEVVLGKMSYLLHWRLPQEVEEHVHIHTASAVGKIQVVLWKKAKAKWSELGEQLDAHDTFERQKDREICYRKCVLLAKTDVTHDTKLFCLQLPPGTHMHVPVGRHVYLRASVQDSEVVKPYTPVDHTLLPDCSATAGDGAHRLFLMIKVYPNGVLSSHLDSLSIGDSLAVSSPEGPFSLRLLRGITQLYLLAAGTGFTPMARLVHAALTDLPTLRKTQLMFFNRQERDILWHSLLDQLAAKDPRFEVEYVLSEPSDSWTGRRGRVQTSMLTDLLVRPEGSKCLVCVCGPTAFTELAVGLVKDLGFSDEEIHAFQG
ncbi:cytochrome b5 reductase 4 isoform X2 [Alosa sapidissima]|uniref:cytochrome b5 reductase 4 isoform X2 n=1 Tax=Alosa sapidissima TaxID=34773 RepID=UPI001C096630|nr:cytochrome b5 reductase 4 isoform X2 [Alosa sapidissima]